MPTLDEQVATFQGVDNLNANLSPLAQDIASLFQPYSNNAYQNYTDVYNDTGFFAFAPEEIRTYLWRVVRRNLNWYRGYVPGLHNQGVLPSKIGSRVCKRMGELIMAGGFRVEGFDAGERFLEKWIKNNKVRLKLTNALPDLNAIGNTLCRLYFKADGGLRLSYVAGNKYFAAVDADLNVTQYVAMIDYISPEPVLNVAQVLKDEQGYYLVEQRKMDGADCYQRYALYQAPRAMTQALFQDAREVTPNRVPKRILSRVERLIGSDVLGKVFKLPFNNHIGAVVILNSATCTTIDYPGFSDSTLQDCHTFLFQYDVTHTQKEGNKYFAQTGVLIPDTMIPPEIANHPSANVQAAFLRNQQSLDGRVYKRIPVTESSREVNKPVFFQADNQSMTYNEDLKEILACIATQVGLTPTALAGNLTSYGQRTATEVIAEDDITRATIETKRDLIREPMTQIFRWVLDHYMITHAEDIDMIFNSSILNNPERETDDLVQQINAGILSRQTAIARKNRAYSKKEVEEEYARIEEERKTAFQAGADGIWNSLEI